MDLITVFGYNQCIYSVFPDVDTSNTRNYVMLINNQTKLYKNSAQTLLLEVRSLSRKYLTVDDRDFYINIIDISSGTLMFRRVAKVLDPAHGRLGFYFQSSDLDGVPPGMYNFSISTIDSNAIETFLFLDQVGNATSNIEIIDKAMPPFVPSIISEVFQYRVDSFLNNGNFVNYYTSSMYPGAGQSLFAGEQHTIAVYCTDFTGKFMVQGSLAAHPCDTDWFNLIITEQTVYSFTEFTGVEAFDFFGPIIWVRFVYIPDPMLNMGTFDKVLYRGVNNPLPQSVISAVTGSIKP